MIRVEIKKDVITVKGHANQAVSGNDIVCASVSTAIIMSVNQIEVFNKAHCIETEIADGYASITVVSEDEVVTKVLDNLIFTFKDLELEYPKYIKINEKI